MYSSMKGIHLGMTLFPLYKSALAFPALEKYYPLFFLALAPVTARPFEYSSSVPCGAQEREKSISHWYGNTTNRLPAVCLGNCFLQKSLSIDQQVPTSCWMTPLWKISYRY